MLSQKEIKELQKSGKARRNQGLFVIEGIRMFRETPREMLVQICVSESFLKDNEKELAGFKYEVLSDSRFRSTSETQNPQGILAVVRAKKWTAESILENKTPKVLILENLQDPGNMGTILRTAEAAGFQGIFMTKDCVDLYNPKVIRSTMGAIYRMPHAIIEDWEVFIKMLAEKGINTYAASLKAEKSYLDPDYTRGCAFMIGNEGNGLTEMAENAANCLIRIPMAGKTESLNAAMAAGILMYEAARQEMVKG